MIPTESELRAPLVRLLRSLSETVREDVLELGVLAIFGLIIIFWCGVAVS